ncbi:helix-turn-helix domain-containing protein [Ruminococcaceae bacterium OttesenSCG-928-D13]|nr:helix-turn-helix domain-containing protein [Ruminococcaceae bacterium OttesenSCG-928-D13]
MPKQPALAKIIRDSRKAKGYSQADLAKLIGMTGCAVSGWETGKAAPTSGAWKRLCGVLWPGRQ